MNSALLIGNSDGIGLALTRRLLDQGWSVTGVSRSPSPLEHERYHHHVADVRAAEYGQILGRAAADLGALDVCVYLAGIGQELSLGDLAAERAVFEVNLMGLVHTVESILPRMLAAGRGHFLALSSLADHFCNPGAPSYSASKAGVSSYLEALALAVRGRGVHITNIRLGFVATKMAQSDVTPVQISADRAADLILGCMARRPIRFTYPRRMGVLLWLAGWPDRVRLWLG
jgi:NAD(P)-dependent dehydrogenase (short-subunit alcohol dehydrogenase family)